MASDLEYVIIGFVLVFFSVTGRNVSPEYCGGVQLCTSNGNAGDMQTFQCNQHCPTDKTCAWFRRQLVSNLVKLSNGSTLTWIAGTNEFGVYDCLDNDNVSVLQVAIIPERHNASETNCPNCLEVSTCKAGDSEIQIHFELIIKESAIYSWSKCELVGNGNNSIVYPSRQYTWQQHNSTNVIHCPLCDSPQHSVYLPVFASTFCSVENKLTTSYTTIFESASMMLTSFTTTRTTFTTPLDVTPTTVGILNPTATSSSAMESGEKSDEGLPRGAIAGIVIAIFAIVLGIALVIIFLCCRNRNRS